MEKSIGGQLWWIHRGKLVKDQDGHYKFGDTQDATKAELEILDAGEEQEGLYEIVLKQAACEIRNVIEVRLTSMCLFLYSYSPFNSNEKKKKAFASLL